MTLMSIALEDEQIARLRMLAEEVGLPADEYLTLKVVELLGEPPIPFEDAAEYVLEKNAELYRRLA